MSFTRNCIAVRVELLIFQRVKYLEMRWTWYVFNDYHLQWIAATLGTLRRVWLQSFASVSPARPATKKDIQTKNWPIRVEKLVFRSSNWIFYLSNGFIWIHMDPLYGSIWLENSVAPTGSWLLRKARSNRSAHRSHWKVGMVWLIAGWCFEPSWKIMEFVNGVGMTSHIWNGK